MGHFYQPRSHHFAGGNGYLNVDGKAISTLYLDHPIGAQVERAFGVGYYHRLLRTDHVNIVENVYAPFATIHCFYTTSRSTATRLVRNG